MNRPPRADPLETVLRYHQETKHDFDRYARSLGHLDWENQPDPFRRYAGSALLALPRLTPHEAPAAPPYDDLARPAAVAACAVGLSSLSRFFEFALAISAWKQAGAVRWALRTNPSSGNLHPTEGYLVTDAVPGLSSTPAVYHYAPREHALELRAALPQDVFRALMQEFPPAAFLVGFTSVHWRETWKYGERAYRYCQHDVGHAIGSARIAAATLGWRMLLLDGVADDAISALLGIDRSADFDRAEREHPDCLAVLWPPAPGASGADAKTVSVPLSLAPEALRAAARASWRGRANRLSRDDPVRWEFLEQVEIAALKRSTETRAVEFREHRAVAPVPASARDAGSRGERLDAGQVIRQRRSALAFDGRTAISSASFVTMLTRVMARNDRVQCDRPMPWDALPWHPRIHLALFVHRVDGLVPGLYMLVRDPQKQAALRAAMPSEFAWAAVPGYPQDLPFFLLQAGDARELAAQLSCHQEIAGDSAFSLGMIAEFESSLRHHGPWFYRRLFWEAGVVGQVLYLEAEAAGLRATGIGCYFDDPVHRVLGLDGTAFQSLYHFTIGGQVDDPRLSTLPPYESAPEPGAGSARGPTN